MKKYKINTTNYYSQFMRNAGKDFSNIVAISRTSPEWFKGENRLDLAPTWHVLRTFQTSRKLPSDKQKYTMDYISNLRKTTDLLEVVESLNNKSVVCYEEPGEFCHRFLLIEYLESIFNIDSIEV